MLLPLDLRRQARLVAVDVGLCRRAREEETEGGADLAVPVDDGGSAAGIIKTYHQVDCSLLHTLSGSRRQTSVQKRSYSSRSEPTVPLTCCGDKQRESTNVCHLAWLVPTYVPAKSETNSVHEGRLLSHKQTHTLYLLHT